jgi:NADPH2:quinone reductase
VFLLREHALLEEMNRLIKRGQMRPVVDQVLDLRKVGPAHERLDCGHGHGKVVLRVTEG